jgi:hypothetical protein
MNPTKHIEQALTEAGWKIDGGFSEHLIVGHDGYDVSILAHSWVWEKARHVFELSDARTERVYWVHAIPTPWQAKLLLDENGGRSEEEPLANPLNKQGE